MCVSVYQSRHVVFCLYTEISVVEEVRLDASVMTGVHMIGRLALSADQHINCGWLLHGRQAAQSHKDSAHIQTPQVPLTYYITSR